MGKWEMVRLGDVFYQIKNGASIKQSIVDGGIPITRIETISDGTINREKLGYAGISDDKYSNFYLEDGDILMSHINSEKHLGKVALYKKIGEERIIHGMNLLCLKSNGANQGYMYYFLKSNAFKNQIPSITKKSVNQASFTVTSLKELVIPLPPLDEQKSIAKNLDLANEIVKGYKEQLAQLDKLVQSVFYEMFGDPVTNEKGWDRSVLSNHLDVIGGYAFKSENFSEEGIPVLRIGNINSGRLKSSNLVFWKADNKLERYMVYPGDLLISLTGTVGKEDYGNICVIGHEFNCYYLNQRNARLKLKGKLDTYYLSFLLKVPEIKGKLTGISRGVRQANISNSDILHLVAPVPPPAIQARFSAVVVEIEAQKAQVQQALTEARNLFNSLMQEYFE